MKIEIEIEGKKIEVVVNTGNSIIKYGLEKQDNDTFKDTQDKDLDRHLQDGSITNEQFEALDEISLMGLYIAFSGSKEDEDTIIHAIGINSPLLKTEVIGDKIDCFQRNDLGDSDIIPHYTPQIEVNGMMLAIVLDDGSLYEFDTSFQALREAELIRDEYKTKH